MAVLSSPRFPGAALGLVLALSAAPACGDDGASAGGAGGTASNTSATVTGPVTGSGSGNTTNASTGSGQTGMPHLGAHGLAYYGYGANDATSIDAPALVTQPSGSTIIVSAGRGDFGAFALPTDNKGNQPYQQLGMGHTYANWPGSGTALYGFPGAVGGADHVVSTTTAPGDEITFAVVEVAGGAHIQDAQWVEKLNGVPITSAAVTTTGPATLVAFWWGDADVNGDKVAVPDNGFVVLDSIGNAGALVQCFVAAKEVSAAGTYDVTWSATPAQGAQLWLVAVQ